MANVITRANPLERWPIGKLLFRYSVPAIVGMVVLALYNVVDRLYVGHAVGQEGLAGFALTFPPMMIMLAFGMLIGIGAATRISITMGRGKIAIARCYLGQSVCFYLILSFIVYPLCAFFIRPLLEATGGTPASIPYAEGYLKIIFFGSIAQYISFGLNNTIRAEGHPGKALLTILIGAVANIILDPFFIFDSVPLGFMRVPGFGLGVRGAAIATVLSLSISALWVLLHFLRPNAQIRLCLGYIRIYPRLIWSMLSVGLPPFLLNILGSAITALYNILFKHYAGSDAVANREIAAIGIVMTIQMLVAMPVIGLAQGMQPILGFNTGARRYDRVKRTFNLAALLGGAWIFVTTALCLLFREELIRVFCNAEVAGDLLIYGPRNLAVFFCGFSFVGYAIIVGQYFQSIGRSWIAIFMSVSRQGLLLIPLIFILPIYFEGAGIWWAAPISDVISILIAVYLHIREYRRLALL